MSTIVNLIPAPRRAARYRQQRITRWAALCAMYILAICATCGLCLVRWGGAGHDTYTRLNEVRNTAQAAEQRMEQLKIRLGQTRQLLHADRLITQRPDWSIMLTLIAETLGDDVVLRACRLSTPGPTANRSVDEQGPAHSPQTLHLHGIATVPLSVSQLALRLEEMDLFSRVAVEETRRESFGHRKVVNFSIECVIEDGAKS